MIEYQNLNEPVYIKVKQMILNGELKQGEKIVQEKIADLLGVSRTPLMRALLALENEYLVESIPRRGMFVRSIGEKELFDIYVCREALEGMAARLLATSKDTEAVLKLKQCFDSFTGVDEIDIDTYTRADERFHSILIKLTGNTPLDKIYFFGNIHDKVIKRGLLRKPEETLEEHIKIIGAIEKGEPELAEKYAREHIKNSRILLLNQ
ncbi:GntR family transcriptional regulator [Cognatitamlana onchidii]|uniref:GntR family transcriptional regulator n=1 Tax=Cognatitamlana onchidii TaxID=2562860 RepID=UPI0010A60D5E|nr:GntR family transcriptional regulator [Algibacter onchidii]